MLKFFVGKRVENTYYLGAVRITRSQILYNNPVKLSQCVPHNAVVRIVLFDYGNKGSSAYCSATSVLTFS